jgi:hypothetical protein
LDHSLPPLGLFLQIKLFSLSLSQTHLFGQIGRYYKSKIDQVSKAPPFSHNQNSPPQETKFCNKSHLCKIQILTLLFLKFTSGWCWGEGEHATLRSCMTSPAHRADGHIHRTRPNKPKAPTGQRPARSPSWTGCKTKALSKSTGLPRRH